MSKIDLVLFKEKYNTSDYFASVVESLFNKLVEYEYMPNSKVEFYFNKFLQNVNEIRFGDKNVYDYKSGYYDATKKELYIKDEKNIPAVYLRLLYALTTSEVESGVYSIGFSTTKLRTDSYKLSHTNFGINRAIASNLVYKLCNLIPLNLQLTTTPKTYTHNFLGFKIEADNELYSLEGKLLQEICYVLDIDPQLLYSGLFSKNRNDYLTAIFNRKKITNKDTFLSLFDSISKTYNTYNKLSFLSNKLNNNYIEYKKNILKNNIDDIIKEQEIIEDTIHSVISNLYENDTSTTEELEVNIGLSEALENLETELKDSIVTFQDILAENIITNNSHLPYIKYASKLKRFNDILIIPNKKLSKAIQDTILFKLLPYSEVTEINLIQKIKYAIVEQILSDTDFTNISNSFSFYNITNLENSDLGTSVILLSSNKHFSRIVEVTGLNQSFNKSSNFELNYIPLDNLKYLMTTSSSNMYIYNIEALYTAIKDSFEELKSVQLDSLFGFEYLNKKYIMCFANNKPYIISYIYTSKGYSFSMLNLSEQYKIFGKSVSNNNSIKSNLPTLYKK